MGTGMEMGMERLGRGIRYRTSKRDRALRWATVISLDAYDHAISSRYVPSSFSRARCVTIFSSTRSYSQSKPPLPSSGAETSLGSLHKGLYADYLNPYALSSDHARKLTIPRRMLAHSLGYLRFIGTEMGVSADHNIIIPQVYVLFVSELLHLDCDIEAMH